MVILEIVHNKKKSESEINKQSELYVFLNVKSFNSRSCPRGAIPTVFKIIYLVKFLNWLIIVVLFFLFTLSLQTYPQYWPAEGSQVKHGDITIQTLLENTSDKITTRKFSVSNAEV